MRLVEAVESRGEDGGCSRFRADEERADGGEVRLDEGVSLYLAISGDLFELRQGGVSSVDFARSRNTHLSPCHALEEGVGVA